MGLNRKPRFEIGDVVASPGAMALLAADVDLAAMLLARHASGDFGDICQDDANLNVESIRLGGGRIMSVYKLFGAGTLWIMTAADRSYTTLLTPDEY